MTTLNSKLQLALLNRKKRRNILEKGFTLVELMIVIVIVGVLSAVALPNFLNQTAKAKATECTTKMSSLLKQVHSDYQLDGDINEAVLSIVDGTISSGVLTTSPSKAATTTTSPDAISRDSNGGLFLYTVANPDAADTQLQIKCQAWTASSGANVLAPADYPSASIDATLEGQGMFGCIDLSTGQVQVSRRLEADGTNWAAGGLSCGGVQQTVIPAI